MASNEGDRLRSMVIASPKWVHRRIQTSDHTTPGRVLLKNSLDLTPPASARIAGSSSRVVIPIAILDKKVLTGFWVRDSSGAPLAVINQERSTRLVADMLVSVVEQAGIEFTSNAAERRAQLKFVNNSEAIAPVPPTALLEAYPQLQAANPTIRFINDFIHLLANSWVVLVEVPEGALGQRTILSYGYDLPMNPVPPPRILQDNDVYSFDVSDPGFSRSLHHEVLVPPELAIFETSLEHGSVTGRVVRSIATATTLGPISHIQNLIFIPRFAKAGVEFRIRPAPTGISAFTRWALLLAWVFILASFAIWLGPTDYYLSRNWSGSISSSVILVAPALFMSWMARAPEPGVVARALYRLRLINILLALSMLTMAGALSVQWSPRMWTLLWLIAYAFGALALGFWLAERAVRKPRKFSPRGNG